MFSFLIVISSFRCKSEFLLSNEIARNLSVLTIILLRLNHGLNQFMAQPPSDSKMLTRFFTVLAKLDKVLPSANGHITQGKEKIVEENIE